MSLSPHQKTAGWLVGVVVVMGAASFAAVPFYDWFCRVTGFGGTTAVASEAPAEVLDRTIRVRFDASREAGMPWEFRPLQREMEVRIGETGLAFYEAYNPTDRTVAGTASYNVTPDAAGGYFAKIACFCFTEQVLAPGERVEMPVSFYVDPAIVKDRDGRYVRQITLSYTFHQTELPEEQAALAARPAGIDVN
ncbi:cytochrome c oxidase assembly protein [Cereibacter azotoformans]|uniref:Cytochrome c oxidase assembly protein CtaG n=2 Tax=Cereibacter TaxID=1653176 RepID=COXZ_CERS5|nr:cytochrome c oxidase assembly protein [Cereibacter azotoformans]A4WQ59.1 RecName: Full=Cytochrome c oxidase assembly protein CtaG [Cereibacter sphaeroides ATCC 17025]AXQ92841.1 cytochrome c oxidase assembly protein [Cereibacter sphaeroides]MBO4169492.1 cytochrome c oxidase assembly protein [Cereibacter azotoformans]PTR18169.1 cytochrome c oxidase assembly protein subunit 11 [Cereibacter azotoformans]UIJ31125.1 cytochrome c oxidase assembly protein [Cereibacter azotoformans]ULB08925.1 cytoc